ncbi:hypothetical protein [Hymenobacter sp. BT190]|uniref:hypothetical protein n=1 Tax=Hymenobacter sp. BT190 TaxID=2763505 RepID=UPI001651814E|nr:hypothetical protein [Hymenobacter sp. BT190]MBC6697153.1 hypothetical protein [Hymenobacter sp. BT190]
MKTDLDKYPEFKSEYVKYEIKSYMKRNNLKDAVYYIKISKSNDTTSIEMSSFIHREFIDIMRPCAVMNAYGDSILIKHSDCEKAKVSNFIKSFVNSNLKSYEPIMKIGANGDTVECHENVFYDPEVMKIYLYGGMMNVIKANDMYISK